MFRSKIPRISRPKKPAQATDQDAKPSLKSSKVPPYIWVLAGNVPLFWALLRPYETETIAQITSVLVVLGIFILFIMARLKAQTTSGHSQFPKIILLLVVPVLFPAVIIGLFMSYGGDQKDSPQAPPILQRLAKKAPLPSPSEPPEQVGSLPDFPTSPHTIWYAETEGMRPGAAHSQRSQFLDFDAPLSKRSTIEHTHYVTGITSGTANALNEGTLWLTARHVVSDCHQILINIGKKTWMRATETYLHPSADVALLRVPSVGQKREPMAFAERDKDVQRAFGIGFPWGIPGGWSGMYMGKSNARHKGAFSGFETTTVWSEVSRIPHLKPHMGGISGGAVLDQSGHLIGIVIAGSPRRGRYDVSTLTTINSLLKSKHINSKVEKDEAQNPYSISDYDYPVFIKSFIRKNRIAKVICNKSP